MTSQTSRSDTFTSEGFDLDAVADNGDNDVIYEIGGGAIAAVSTPPLSTEEPQNDDDNDNNNNNDNNKKNNVPLTTPLQQAEDWKQRGNAEFKRGNYLEAYDLYTEAITVCPCPIKGEDILHQREEFNATEREKARQRMEDETRRSRKKPSRRSDDDQEEEGKEPNSKTNDKDAEAEEEEEDPKKGPAVFVLPPQDHGDKLAVYYCNRAATSMQLERYQEAIEDCDIAVLLNPKYTKAYTRRSAAYEKTERTDEALRDAKYALELEPTNATIRKSVTRLQKMEDERLEKLKEETLSKLKDLGNSLLGNFGLSLDNFKAVQDPNTGSYSISFNQSN
ncbi:tetratricopeptide repeat protein [Nitzschia inconspicua]|uniref:Tetratricopeptide repeat protein n=1 Tax=Nitzschia inconspicua TaxID=303405 RepID=A0A9K3LIX6_9STRA|nr:tetratricopeptide repeat protein [Nitzschia inconspicua]